MHNKDDKSWMLIAGIGVAFMGGMLALCFSNKCKKKKKMEELEQHQNEKYSSEENTCHMKE